MSAINVTYPDFLVGLKLREILVDTFNASLRDHHILTHATFDGMGPTPRGKIPHYGLRHALANYPNSLMHIEHSLHVNFSMSCHKHHRKIGELLDKSIQDATGVAEAHADYANGTFTIDLRTLSGHINAHSPLGEKLRRYQNHVRLYTQALSRFEDNHACSDLGHLWKIVADGGAEKGTYFHSKHLLHVFDTMVTREMLLAHDFKDSALHLLSEDKRLRIALCEWLHTHGYRRIAMLDKGRECVAFLAGETKDHNARIIVFAPPHQQKLPAPFVLPAIEEVTLRGKLHSLKVRVMPEVEIASDKPKNERDRLYEELHKVAALCGADLADLNTYNYGTYRFQRPGGMMRTLPVILDWGSAFGRHERLQERCKALPELEPWREMERHIAGLRGQNLADNTTLQQVEHALTGGDGCSSTVDAIREHGLYPDEVGEAAERVTAHILQNPGDDLSFSRRLRAESERVARSGEYRGKPLK